MSPSSSLTWMLVPSLLVCAGADNAAEAAESGGQAAESTLNKPERVEWFQDQGLGMFVHWGVDCPLGSVISHSMAGASEAYLDRYIEELPQAFLPKRFDPDEWARLAKLAGMRYAVFTTKHHSGFCMFDTATTEFNVMNTPYGEDVTATFVEAFRRQGIAIGFYFSPDDFWLLHKQGLDVSRKRPEAQPTNNPDLMKHNLAQLRELLTNYGPIDVLFLDGEPDGLKELAWELQPDIVVTRGAMETPEQRLPGEPMPGPWEACFTLGTQWQYKPTNETYKSGARLIEMLVETRAKGGNLLLNTGPKPSGEIPQAQEDRMREMALWLFVNREAIYDIRPWHITNEGNIWFTQAKDGSAVYAICTVEPWPWGKRRTITLKSVRATDGTQVDVLGHGGRVLEYHPDADPSLAWTLDEEGLHISAMRAQRLYNDRTWPNPVVLRVTNAEYADAGR